MQETEETQLASLGEEDPLEEEMQPTPGFLPEKSHRQRSLVGYSPLGRKESDRTEQLSLHVCHYIESSLESRTCLTRNNMYK